MLGLLRFGGRVLAALALAGLASATMPVRAADTTPFEIYSIASLTGFGAFLGKAQQDTLQRLEASVNKNGGIKGRPIHFTFTTTRRTRKSRSSSSNQILDEKCQLLVGPTLTAPCLAVMPLVQGKMVQWCASPGHSSGQRFVFVFVERQHDRSGQGVRAVFSRPRPDAACGVISDRCDGTRCGQEPR